VIGSWWLVVAAGKDMSMEAEEYLFLGAATKQEAHEDTTDCEDME
jgi:hypothetical protein